MRARYLMGTLCEARAFGDAAVVEAALEAALDRIAALEDVMTTWRPDGELARLNDACRGTAPVARRISADLFTALRGARDWAERTAGVFDPTVGALADAWGLRTGGRVPGEAEIDWARARTSWRLLALDAEQGAAECLVSGVALDLGGYGKGFALDAAAEVLRARGVRAALFNFGGQVLALGAPPGEPGWIAALTDPRDRERAVAELRLRDESASTSGNLERGFVAEGRHYGHVLDPRTGRPAPWNASLTVVAGSAANADALSTALLVAGPQAAAELLPAGTEFVALESAAPGSGLVVHGSEGLRRRLVWISTGRR